jgi:ABC-type sugar transport system ATPase subunit
MRVPGHLLVRDLSVQLDDFLLLGLNLEVQKGEYFVLLGPTGSGKTVLLEAIAGIIPPQSGTIHLDGKDITGNPPELRRVGFVYQNYALFPHLTVEKNISYGLVNRDQIDNPAESEARFGRKLPLGLTHIFQRRLRKQASIRDRVQDMSSLLQITHLLDRKPGTLSGGEKNGLPWPGR